MEARFITDRQQWDDFVGNFPYGNVTQSFDWGKLASHAGSIPLHIGVVDEQGQLCAAMLVLVTRFPVLRSCYLYAPRGPIITDPESPALTVLLNFVKSEARKRGAFMLKVEPGVEVTNEALWKVGLERRGFRQASQSVHVRNEWILDVRPEEKDILAQMKEKWRYNIRVATRKGVKVRQGSGREDLEAFYRVHQETSERDGFFIHTLEHYQLFMDVYGEDDRAALLLAEYDGKVIAGLILMRYGKWCWYRYGASSSQYRNVMPNHLLQWTGMQWAREHGCEFYNFLGIPTVLDEPEVKRDPQFGVYSFKRGFGGFNRLSMHGYDLPYNPVVYQLYRRMIDFKRWREARQFEREFDAREAAEKEKAQAKESSKEAPVKEPTKEVQPAQA